MHASAVASESGREDIESPGAGVRGGLRYLMGILETNLDLLQETLYIHTCALLTTEPSLQPVYRDLVDCSNMVFIAPLPFPLHFEDFVPYQSEILK